MTGRRAPRFPRARLAPPTVAAVAAAVALLLLPFVAAEVDLPRHLRDALDLVERAYVVAFFDAARFRLLCP